MPPSGQNSDVPTKMANAPSDFSSTIDNSGSATHPIKTYVSGWVLPSPLKSDNKSGNAFIGTDHTNIDHLTNLVDKFPCLPDKFPFLPGPNTSFLRMLFTVGSFAQISFSLENKRKPPPTNEWIIRSDETEHGRRYIPMDKPHET